MKTSIILLTYNRKELVRQSVNHNFVNAGYPIDEIIWVDNGSTDGLLMQYMPILKVNIRVLFSENQGVATGYNAGLKLATGDMVCLPGTDMLLPDNWLKYIVEGLEVLPDAGIVSIPCMTLDICPERKLGEERWEGDLHYIPAITLGSRAWKRNVIEKVGYLPVLKVKYGWSDTEFEYKVRQNGFMNYYLLGRRENGKENILMTTHLGDRDRELYPEYYEFKIGEMDKHARGLISK